MNTFSENGNGFVGRLLHEGGVSRRSFSAFPQTQKASTGIAFNSTCKPMQTRQRTQSIMRPLIKRVARLTLAPSELKALLINLLIKSPLN